MDNSSATIVTAAIVIEHRKVILARRSKSKKLGGMWEFPGGKLEIGESIKDCLEREISEELGVECVAGEIYLESTYHFDDSSINLIGILASLESYEFTLSVHDKVEWVKIDDIVNYNLTPADIPIGKKLIEEFCKTSSSFRG